MKNPAGLWINGEKYYIMQWDQENNCAYLKSTTGGGCLFKTVQGIAVGIWKKTGKAQSLGSCNKNVEAVANQLIDQGY